MTIWVIVISLAVVGGVPVLPNERPQGYLLKQDCVARVPEIRRRWDALGLPPPVKVTCEVLEMQAK